MARRKGERKTQTRKSETTFVVVVLESDKVTEKSDNEILSEQSRCLSREEEKVKASYLFCCDNFYSLQEMINYMKENHGLAKTTVTNVFRELLKGRNAEAYLRVSQKRALQRSSNGVSSSSSPSN